MNEPMRETFTEWALFGGVGLLALAVLWRLAVRYRRKRAARREPGFEPGDTVPDKPPHR